MKYFLKLSLMIGFTLTSAGYALAQAAPAPATLENYSARLAQASGLLSELDASEFDPEAQTYLTNLLPAQEQIQFSDRTIEINNAWLADEIKLFTTAQDPAEQEKIYQRIVDRVNMLSEHLTQLNPTDTTRGDAERAKLKEILSRRDFAVRRGETLTERVWKWVADQLAKLFSFLPQRGEGFNRVIRWVAVIIAITVAVLAAVLLWRHFKRDRKAKPEGKKVILGEEITPETTAESLAEAAVKLAQSGDFRGAIRKLYVSLLFEFDRRGLLRLHASTTNREYLNKLRPQVALFPLMAELTDRFDYFWYGQFASSEADFNDFFANYRRALESGGQVG